MKEEVLVIAAIYFLSACAFDLKKRIVPDWLNYGAIAVAFGSAAWLGVLSLEFAAGVAAAFVFAYAVYRLGAWAGGDVKFFTGATAFFLLAVPTAGWTVFATLFFNSVLLAIPVVIALHAKGLLNLRKELALLAVPALQKAAKTGLLGAAAGIVFVNATGFLAGAVNKWVAYATVFLAALAVPLPLWAAAIVFAAGALLDWQRALYLLVLAFATGFVAFCLVKAFGLVSAKLLRKTIAAKELREGMIPAKTVLLREGKPVVWEGPSFEGVLKAAKKLDAQGIRGLLAPQGRVLADARKARGLTEAEIKELKAAGVTSLETKESLAFAPVLAAGWVASALWGLNWLLP